MARPARRPTIKSAVLFAAVEAIVLGTGHLQYGQFHDYGLVPAFVAVGVWALPGLVAILVRPYFEVALWSFTILWCSVFAIAPATSTDLGAAVWNAVQAPAMFLKLPGGEATAFAANWVLFILCGLSYARLGNQTGQV